MRSQCARFLHIRLRLIGFLVIVALIILIVRML